MRVNTNLNWVLPKAPIRKGATAALVIVLALILDGCYIGKSAHDIDFLAGIPLVVVVAVAAAVVAVLDNYFLLGLTHSKPRKLGRFRGLMRKSCLRVS